MKKIAKSSLGYLIFGLVFGVFYREFPRFLENPELVAESQLSVVHTHTIALGTFFFLFVLIFAKLFDIHHHRQFNKFFGFYHAGVGLTTFMMVAHGIYVALGNEPHAAFSGIAGIGHILITIGFAYFFYILIKSIPEGA